MMRFTQIGRYEILEELGQGAMGAVYKARDPMMDRTVAVKTILSSALLGPLAAEYRERFFREARAAGRLSHPGLVTVHDVGEHESLPFLVMEYIQGRTLASALDAGERFTFDRIYDLGKQIAEALGYAHRNGVIHRDIKPANILLTAGPTGEADRIAKVTDFGVAKLTAMQMTQTGQLLGTPSFMPPEQFTGAPVDGRSDLFSLGVILYWMTTGDKPFTGDTITAVSYKVVHTEAIPPRKLNPAISQALERIILRCLQKDPALRYPTGEALAADIEHARASRATVVMAADRQPAMPDPDATLDAHEVVSRPAPAPAPRPARPAAPLPQPPSVPLWKSATASWTTVAVFLLALGGVAWWGAMRMARQEPASETLVADAGKAAKPEPDTGQARPAPPPDLAREMKHPAPVAPPKHEAAGKSAGEATPLEAKALADARNAQRMARDAERMAEAIRKNVEAQLLASGVVPPSAKVTDLTKATTAPAIPPGRVRLRIDTTMLPRSLVLIVRMDEEVFSVRVEREPRKEAAEQRPGMHYVLVSPGSHRFRAFAGFGQARLAPSNEVTGVLQAGEERTLRVRIRGRPREGEPPGKTGDRTAVGLSIRLE
jgi:serine/threonine-protein kinase